MAVRDLIGPAMIGGNSNIAFLITRGLGNYEGGASSEGMQWTHPSNRLHYTHPESRLHYTAKP